MRRKLIVFFVFLVFLPVITTYTFALFSLKTITNNHMQTLYQNHAIALGKVCESYFADAKNLSLYPLVEKNLKQFYLAPSGNISAEIYQQANNSLSSLPFVFSGSIRNIALVRTDEKFISIGSELKSAHILSPEEKAQADALNGQPLWIYPPENTSSIIIVRTLKNIYNLKEKIGYIKISLNISSLLINLNQELKTLNAIGFFQTNNQIFLPIQNTSTQLDASFFVSQKKNPTHFMEEQAKDYLFASYTLESIPLSLHIGVKTELSHLLLPSVVLNFSIITLVTLGFTIVLAFTFSKIITKPLETLGIHMQSISREDFSVRAEIKGKDEITQLANNFNHMVATLDSLYNDVYLSQIQVKEAQLLALQAQLNPHFLYNTLDTIYWMNQMGDNQSASKMVSNLSQMMRLTLTPDNQAMIPLEDELKHLEAYIEIQKIRYQNNLIFQLHWDENLKKAFVMKNILQPFVENAISHGFSRKKEGLICITIYKEDQSIFYQIKNNGEAIDLEKISTILNQPKKEMKGFALRNIAERLKLKYGTTFQLKYYIENNFSVFLIEQKWQVKDD